MTYEQSQHWHSWFAWHPVWVRGKKVWGKTVMRRDVCSEAAAWACAPIWEYRSR